MAGGVEVSEEGEENERRWAGSGVRVIWNRAEML